MWRLRPPSGTADQLDRRLWPEAEPVTRGLYIPGARDAGVPYAMDRLDGDRAWTGNAGAIDIIGLTARETPFVEPFTSAGTGRPLLTITATGRTWSAAGVDDGARCPAQVRCPVATR
jgi:hypothetical protein